MAEIEYQSKDKERVDRFLATLLNCSREKIQKLLDENKINVNNRSAKKNYLLKPGDKIETFEDKIEKKELDTIAYFPLKLDIVKEKPDYLVINKPAGLIVHPLRSLKEKTLVTALLNFYPEIKGVGDPALAGLRPGIVHRLDKEVSGLILVAKTQRAFDYFKEEFEKHRVQKEYLALVHGQPTKKTGIINLALIKKGAKTLLAKTASLEKIKDSWTEYEVIRRFAPTRNYADRTRTNADIQRKSASSQRQSANIFTLLKVKILTGRTHQIRIHLKSINCPIVGDKEYKIKRQKIINLGRIFLHSYKLGFYDQSGEWQEYQKDLPMELKDFLNNLD